MQMRRLLLVSFVLLLLALTSCGVKTESYSITSVDLEDFPYWPNDSLIIELDIQEPQQVLMILYDVLGDSVDVILDSTLTGDYKVSQRAGAIYLEQVGDLVPVEIYSTDHLSSGVYFVRVTAGTEIFTRKMLVVN